jgi:hypothetical protein
MTVRHRLSQVNRFANVISTSGGLDEHDSSMRLDLQDMMSSDRKLAVPSSARK